MANQLLRDTDVFSMANSLEVRVPFIDHKLVELLAKIPSRYKLKRDIHKRLLIKAIGDKLPHEIAYRKKTGFNFPFDLWMRRELKDFIYEKIKDSKYLNNNFSKKLLDGFEDKKVEWSRIWSCVVLNEWIESNEKIFFCN